jgi:tRNA uridine 5-carboxymethylaminomethyl modification enzyme
MFTSRAEYRLLLREDNADLRLCEKGYDRGLVSREYYYACQQKKKAIQKALELLEKKHLMPDGSTNARLKQMGLDPLKNPSTLKQFLRRPGIHYPHIIQIGILSEEAFSESVWEEVEIQVKYESYIEREKEQVERFRKMEYVPIPQDIDFRSLHGLSNEVKEKLEKTRPLSLGQASRISGVTPAAIAALVIHLKKIGAL